VFAHITQLCFAEIIRRSEPFFPAFREFLATVTAVCDPIDKFRLVAVGVRIGLKCEAHAHTRIRIQYGSKSEKFRQTKLGDARERENATRNCMQLLRK
jgi:hypothetical protein